MTGTADGAAAANTMPAADIDLDVATVRRLLDRAVAEHGLDPDLAGREIRFATNGWDNALFRLGADHVIRIPRREASVALVGNEQRWLPELAPRLPVPIPTPVFSLTVAAAGEGERPWSIVPWFEGVPFADRRIDDEAAARLATDLAAFLHRLHRPASADAPPNPFRGVPLADRAERTAGHLEPGTVATNAVADDADDADGAADGVADGAAEVAAGRVPHVAADGADRLRAWWALALDQPVWDRRPRWIHGDLHPLNILWDDDEEHLVAVIDFGDLTGGDPATDLAVAWHLFPDPDQRRRFRAAARIDDEPVDPATWIRAAGWALTVSAAIINNSADHPMLFELGRRTLRVLAAEDPDG